MSETIQNSTKYIEREKQNLNNMFYSIQEFY